MHQDYKVNIKITRSISRLQGSYIKVTDTCIKMTRVTYYHLPRVQRNIVLVDPYQDLAIPGRRGRKREGKTEKRNQPHQELTNIKGDCPNDGYQQNTRRLIIMLNMADKRGYILLCLRRCLNGNILHYSVAKQIILVDISSMRTHTGPTSHWVEDSWKHTYTHFLTSLWEGRLKMGSHTGSTSTQCDVGPEYVLIDVFSNRKMRDISV